MAKKNAVSAKAARLLRRVARHILAEPCRYDQNAELSFLTPGMPYKDGHVVPACGTIGCIAGWVTALVADNPRNVDDPLDFAAHALGLDHDQKWILFDSVTATDDDYWPSRYAQAYVDAKTPRGRARVAARRIEHFIKTGE